MNNADMPAMPISVSQSSQGDFLTTDDYGVGMGLTKREQFCLQMGVPETGDPELDSIIIKGERKRIAVMAMQGILSSEHYADFVGRYEDTEGVAIVAINHADGLLEGLGYE